MRIRLLLNLLSLFILFLIAAFLVACSPESERDDAGSTIPAQPTTYDDVAAPTKPVPPTDTPDATDAADEQGENGEQEDMVAPGELTVDLSAGESIAFAPLLQGDLFNADIEQPAIFVAGSPEEAEAFTSWMMEFDPSMVDTVAGTDFDANVAAALFAGAVGSSGYSITVQDVSVVDGEVRIVVEIGEPDPNSMVQTVISYPFQVIAVSRDLLPDGPARWLMVDDAGTVLAEMTY
jgi:hypothetical protein